MIKMFGVFLIFQRTFLNLFSSLKLPVIFLNDGSFFIKDFYFNQIETALQRHCNSISSLKKDVFQRIEIMPI